jgi:hypothetical protein
MKRSNGWQVASSYSFDERPRKFQSARDLDFRGFLATLALRDMELRCRRTALGVAWVAPLLASGIVAVVFGTAAGIVKPGNFADVIWH